MTALVYVSSAAMKCASVSSRHATASLAATGFPGASAFIHPRFRGPASMQVANGVMLIYHSVLCSTSPDKEPDENVIVYGEPCERTFKGTFDGINPTSVLQACSIRDIIILYVSATTQFSPAGTHCRDACRGARTA